METTRSANPVKITGCSTCAGSGWEGYIVARWEQRYVAWHPIYQRCPAGCTHKSRAASIARQKNRIRDAEIGEAMEQARAEAPARPPATKRPAVAPPKFQAVTVLLDGIKRSRMYPKWDLDEKQRESGAYKKLFRTSGGEHRWSRLESMDPQEIFGGILVTVDRNGSYPSACSSVPVAPAMLTRTGPLESRGASAGLFYVTVPEWEDETIGHPLGIIADGRAKRAWISTPHMILLDQLAAAGTIPRVAIHDSWTGRSNSNLFAPFYREYRDARAAATGDEAATAALKKYMGIALQLLWPDEAQSPFYRPDWRVAIVAEAAVRHWLKAYTAVAQGAVLVSMRTVDEATFLTPAGLVPSPYVLGTGFGQVKVKPQSAVNHG